jgi:hypothetical protein
MRTFDDLAANYRWRPIRNCPGRYVLQEGPVLFGPGELVGEQREWPEYRLAGAKDPLTVIHVEGGGLISYRRKEGLFVHTLNTTEGLERKLEQLGLRVDPASG